MDKNSPEDLYNWFMKTRMVEPRNCQELLTTAGIVGIILVFPILVGEWFLSAVIIGALKGIVEA